MSHSKAKSGQAELFPILERMEIGRVAAVLASLAQPLSGPRVPRFWGHGEAAGLDGQEDDHDFSDQSRQAGFGPHS